MLPSFIKYISDMDEAQLSQWLLDGLSGCYSGADLRPCRAFHKASSSFGEIIRGQALAEEELGFLYWQLDVGVKSKFSRAINLALDKTDSHPENAKILDALIDVGLNTDPDSVIESVVKKLSIVSADARNKICLQSAFLLAEASDIQRIKMLALKIIERDDYPDSISAHLLVALCKSDPKNAEMYAQKIAPHFAIQHETLSEAKRGYSRFKQKLSEALPEHSRVFAILKLAPQ